MPIIQTIGTAAARAYGFFKKGLPSLTGNYLYLWGDNSTSQLGQYMVGTTVARSSPVQIGTRAFGTSLSCATSSSAAMAIDASGALWGWGLNTSGQLGDGTATTKSSPVQVGTLTNWLQVSVGSTASGAIKTDGTLWTWGAGTSGQLGDGTTVTKSSPVQIGTLTTWSSISCGQTFMLARKTDGTLWAWGLQTGGRLGNGVTSATGISSPVQIGTLTNWTSADCGVANGFGVAGGALYSWGTAGAILGYGSTVATSVPTQIGTLTTWSSVNAGDTTAAALKANGTLWTWGAASAGQLGDGTTVSKSSPVQVGTLTTWSSISIGSASAVALQSNGTLWGWGQNTSGQLGQNNLTNYSSPVQVGTLTNWTAASTAISFSAFIGGSGALFTTGAATTGQLGQTAPTTSSPVVVGLGTNKFNTVSGGDGFVLALAQDRTLYTWGENGSGQLGNGATAAIAAYPSYPVQVNTDTNWSSIKAMQSNAMAVKSTGALWSWGAVANGGTGLGGIGSTVSSSPALQIPNQMTNFKVSSAAQGVYVGMMVTTGGALYGLGQNTNGAIGDGTTINKSSPVQIGTLTNWAKVAVAANDYNTVAAIKTDGTLWTWGSVANGALGDGATANRSSPVQIGTLTNWSSVASTPNNAGFYAIKTDGTSWSWGDNTNFDLGNGSVPNTAALSYPVQYGQSATYTDFLMGQNQVFLLKPDNSLYAAGYNTYGQLGDGTSISRNSPVQIGTTTSLSKLGAGGLTTYQIRSNGTLWSWGQGIYGQLGVGGNYRVGTAISSTSSPVQMSLLWTTLGKGEPSGSGYTGGGITTSGSLWGWGYNYYGQVGDGTSSTATSPGPVPVGTLQTWTSLASAIYSTFALKSDNTLWAWGYNNNGELAQGNTTNYSSPVQVGTLTDWSAIFAGANNVAAIKTNGTLWTWANNSDGQLGQGNTTNYSSPVQVGTLTTWATAAIANSLAAIKTDGTLWTCGYNNQGQLGDGSTNSRSSLAQVGTLTTWSKVYQGAAQMYAIKTNGTLWAWGNNSAGCLGDGTIVGKSSPVQIGTLTNWSKVSSSANYAIALKTDGTLWAWGYNGNGQLGQGNVTNYSSPVQIGTLTNWTDIAAYGSCAMAVNSSNQGYAWGNNTEPNYAFVGTFGVAPPAYSLSPIQVGTVTTWSSVSGGYSHAAAIRSDGTIWTWGSNDSGATAQTPGSASYATESPTQVGTLTNWSKVASGYNYSIAIKNDGSLWGWGYNGAYNINSTGTNYSSPVQIGTLTTWSDVQLNSLASTTLVVKNDGTAWAWGNNSYGQAGVNSDPVANPQITVPTQVTLAGTITSAYPAGSASSFKSGSDWYVCGYQQLMPNGFTTGYSSPVQMPTIQSWSKVGFSNSYIGFALNTSNVPFGWGSMTSALPANPTVIAGVSSPVQIGTLTTWSTPNITTSGNLYTWGTNPNGNLGFGDNIYRNAPTQLGTQTWTQFASGVSVGARPMSIGVRTDGTLWAWGSNYTGSLGYGVTTNDYLSPVQVGTLSTWSGVATSGRTSWMLKTDGTLWGTGANANYTIGDGTTVDKSSPVQIGLGTPFSSVGPGSYSAGNVPTFAITTNNLLYSWGNGQIQTRSVIGTSVTSPTQLALTGSWTAPYIRNGALWVFGSNVNGQLGLGDTFDRLGPVQVGTQTNWSKVSFGGAFAAAVKTDGTLWTWGQAALGKLGNGTTTPNTSSPAQVGTLTNWSDVVCGASHTIAIKTDGTMWVWGSNNAGRLGDGTTINRSSPVQIGTLTTWAKAAAYSDSSAATKTDGTLWAWGYNYNGQVGDGTTVAKSNPTQIGTLTSWVLPESNAFGTFAGALRS